MHSRNPTKDVDEFQKEFERILEDAENRVADFREFFFPGVNCREPAGSG